MPQIRKEAGFISFIAIILVIIVLATGGYIALKANKQTPKPLAQPSSTASASANLNPSPSPTSTPEVAASASPTSLVDCVGPDGKHIQLEAKACDSFKKAWATPTPSPTATSNQTSSTSTTGCSAYNLGGDLGQLTVSIHADNGSVQGDAAVTMKDKYSGCAGVDPGFPYTQILSQGQSSIKFSGMRPGPFIVSVLYHGKTFDSDVNISSGSNSINVAVSN